jgi:endonuclease YncB( thermonuclease family)
MGAGKGALTCDKDTTTMSRLILPAYAAWVFGIAMAHAQAADLLDVSGGGANGGAAMEETASPAIIPTVRRPAIWQQPSADTAIPTPVSLDRPAVINTARLQSGDTIVSLYGIEGVDGDPASQLQAFLLNQYLSCQPAGTDEFTCLLPDGTDVAQASVINGVARARADAPDVYKQEESEAQAARRGIWADASLLPSVAVAHPVVQDTATLVADRRTLVLDGVHGLGQPYSSQLQDYIATNGDQLRCVAQATAGHFVCTTNGAADIAEIALTNGAAVITATASEVYRAQQADAIAHRRGVWATQPAPAADFALAAGDDGADGITYVNGAPWAWVDGRYVMLAFGGAALGWGFYDYYHHWQGAPAGYSAHLDRFHAGGAGLRGAAGGFAGDAGGARAGRTEVGGVGAGGAGHASFGGAGHDGVGGAGRDGVGGAGHDGVGGAGRDGVGGAGRDDVGGAGRDGVGGAGHGGVGGAGHDGVGGAGHDGVGGAGRDGVGGAGHDGVGGAGHGGVGGAGHASFGGAGHDGVGGAEHASFGGGGHAGFGGAAQVSAAHASLGEHAAAGGGRVAGGATHVAAPGGGGTRHR